MNLLSKTVKCVGHACCGTLCLLCATLLDAGEGVARMLVGTVAFFTRARVALPPFPTERFRVGPEYEDGSKDFIDENATKAKSSFPIKEADLIDKCKEVIRSEFGCKKPSVLSEDFLFIFPVVGPLTKTAFIEAFSSFKLDTAMTGSANFFGFTVDPIEPNRVWFFSRSVLKHTGDLRFGAKKLPASGKTVEHTPQVLSMSFTDAGLCYKFTGGYPVDRTVGNAGGLGGLFGILHALGGTLPFPEGKPWRPSLRWEAFARHFPAIVQTWKGKH